MTILDDGRGLFAEGQHLRTANEPPGVPPESASPPTAVASNGRSRMGLSFVVSAGQQNGAQSSMPQNVTLALPALHNSMAIVPGGPNYWNIPVSVRQMFVRRNVYIPLSLLTNAACADQGADSSASLTELMHFDMEMGHMVASTTSHITELRLSFVDWHTAWRRLLQLYREYCPEEYSYWSKHFKRIRDYPGVVGDDWSVW
jgi:hypothetical protein